MKTRPSSHVLILAAFVVMTVAVATSATEPVARTVKSADAIAWHPNASNIRLTMTISSPNGQVRSFDLDAGEVLRFRVKDLPGGALDGHYTYELSAIHRVARSRTEAFDGSPDADPAVQSGSFLVRGGMLVTSNETERLDRKDGRDGQAEDATAPNGWDRPTAQPEDQAFFDDVIIDGSLCVGFDCSDGEPFGFDTIRLKENNTRLYFLDTSSTSAFPQTDWQLTANETINGGLNMFAIEDVTAGTTPFKVLGSAPTNSIVVDASGRIGLRTATPALDVHVKTGNTPAIRLDQDGTKGFTPRTWDIGANEVSFFIRDQTASSLRLEILPNGSWRTSTGATLSSGGAWTNASSIELKQNVELLDSGAAVSTLLGLEPVTFAYKADPNEQYVGFIAEDVPDLVATNDRRTLSPMDVVAVLTKVVQDQQTTIEELVRRIEQLERGTNDN